MSDSFKDFILDQLSDLPDLHGKSMFGGFGLYCGDAFFGIIHKARLYFRTSEATRTRYIAAGMSCFTPNEKQALRSYYEVPADVIDSRTQLADWAVVAINTAKQTR
jgi:DNA transformation protein and related proteins